MENDRKYTAEVRVRRDKVQVFLDKKLLTTYRAETNGARMVAPNSVGGPSTLTDDVVIDGKIMTGQDDPTAGEMGRQLAMALLAK